MMGVVYIQSYSELGICKVTFDSPVHCCCFEEVVLSVSQRPKYTERLGETSTVMLGHNRNNWSISHLFKAACPNAKNMGVDFEYVCT